MIFIRDLSALCMYVYIAREIVVYREIEAIRFIFNADHKIREICKTGIIPRVCL